MGWCGRCTWTESHIDYLSLGFRLADFLDLFFVADIGPLVLFCRSLVVWNHISFFPSSRCTTITVYVYSFYNPDSPCCLHYIEREREYCPKISRPTGITYVSTSKVRMQGTQVMSSVRVNRWHYVVAALHARRPPPLQLFRQWYLLVLHLRPTLRLARRFRHVQLVSPRLRRPVFDVSPQEVFSVDRPHLVPL